MIKKFDDLKGKVITSLEQNEDKIKFSLNDGESYKLSHDQNCCEIVYIESIEGNLEDLIDSEILFAEESSNSDDRPVEKDYISQSYTWTFYRIGTIKGSVVIRWFGSSNGYYSESVDLYHYNKETGNYDYIW